jgi:hypothetical protein
MNSEISGPFLVQEGDRLTFCFNDNFGPDVGEETQRRLKEKFPEAAEVTVVSNVAAVLVQREAEGNVPG